MSSKDIRQLIKKLEAQGFTVTPTRNGHYRVSKNGTSVTTLPGTPSDHRSMKNCLAYLKRAGFKP